LVAATESTADGSVRCRILHICQPTDGGVAVAVRELVRSGIAHGHHVSVGCPAGGKLPEWLREIGVRWIPLPLTRAPSIRDLARLPAVRRLARGADVVHLHSSKAGAVGRVALLGMRGKCLRIFTPHGWSWYVGGRLAPVYRLFERAAARWVDVITAVSPEEAHDGRNVLGRRATGLVLIENGVDTTAFHPEGPTAVRVPDPLLVCVGRICEQKGQDQAVRVLAALRDRSVRLRLVGDGPQHLSVAELARTLGVADRMEFVPHTDPAPHLRAADVVLLPSRWEGMSLLLLEAMACGAAIVSTRSAGSSALGDAGICVPVGDVPAMVAAVEELLASCGQRTALGRRARERAVARYSLSRMTASHLELIRPVVSAQAEQCGSES
jgi:glycosyltransferase involved in cell wall biosynthesis